MRMPPPLTRLHLLRALAISAAVALLYALICSLPIWVGPRASEADLLPNIGVVARCAYIGFLLGTLASGLVFSAIFIWQIVCRICLRRTNELWQPIHGLGIGFVFILPALITYLVVFDLA